MRWEMMGWGLLLFKVILGMGCATVQAQSTHTWREMGEFRQVEIEPGLVAVFTDGTPQGKSKALSSRSLGSLQLVQEYGSVQLFKTEASLKTLSQATVAGASPVFRDQNGGVRRMALPGTILVQFKAKTTESEAREWAVQQGMSLVRPQAFPLNSFVFLYQSGLPSLTKANELHSRPEVQFAQPDWWMETGRR